MRTHARRTLLAMLLACGLAGCADAPVSQEGVRREGEGDVPTVYVVNYPLKYFAERIGSRHVDVVFPAPTDEDPAFWTPDTETVIAFQQADLILLNGASYARWTSIVSLPDARTVDTSGSVADQYIEVADAVTHAHGPGGEHAHGETAFTTWLDPKLALEQARAIALALSDRWPEGAAQFETGFAALQKDLMELDATLAASLAGAKDRPLVFSHPVYQYFERRYGLNGRSVHWEPNETPTEAQWSELAELLKSHPAECMIWEAEPAPATVARLHAMGVQSVVFAPCGNTPASGDYFNEMQQNAKRLARVVQR